MKTVSIMTRIVILIALIACSKNETFTILEKDNIKIYSNNGIPSNPEIEYKLKEVLYINFNSEDGNSDFEIKYPVDFEIDNDGNIYVLDILSSKVEKFNKNGKYITSISNRGSGPGESIYPNGIILDKDSLLILNSRKRAILNFDLKGNYRHEMKYDNRLPSGMEQIGNNYLGMIDENIGGDSPSRSFKLTICNNTLDTLKTIYNYNIDLNNSDFYNNFLDIFPPYCASDSLIYVSGNSSNEYKIDVYDFHGNKKSVISKNYRKHPISDNEKMHIIKEINLKEPLVTDIPNKFKKAINYIIIEERGAVWVMTPDLTSEKDINHIKIDIFKNGIYQNSFYSTELEYHLSYSDNLFYKIKNGYLYQMSNKDGNLKVFEIIKK
ncbi:MAG: 6-bladed beta-propeller [Candidatus Delongbacteria bacterium]|nr:6-bladed beta-propeller [Candidatus Delongbacteria bacterium]MBN2836624.1 6-bladed beta-propeller [Candidatus Delongbacteria bacterium]